MTYFPAITSEMGSFMHAVESEMLCSSSMPTKVPYFNAPIYLQNKTQIGKVDEILGPINEVFFTVKMNDGMLASSFKKDDKVYIGGDKLLPIERFLPKPKAPAGASESRGMRCVAMFGLTCYFFSCVAERGKPAGGRGGARGGRGAPRGRGGFGDRGGRGKHPAYSQSHFLAHKSLFYPPFSQAAQGEASAVIVVDEAAAEVCSMLSLCVRFPCSY